jgi:ribosomal protein L35
MASHLLGKKSPKRKRSFRRAKAVARPDVSAVKRLLGRG